MSSNNYGNFFRLTSFGESHGPALGVVIDGVLPGLELNEEDIQKELDRRKPGQSLYVSPRNEADRVEILSGLYEGKTTGAPIAMLIRNTDARPQDYEYLKEKFRPGRGEFAWFLKYGIHDPRGGGRLSGRETAARVAAGALAKKLLNARGIDIVGYTKQIGHIKAYKFDPDLIERNPLRCPDEEAAGEMQKLVEEIRAAGDSIGGIVEIKIKNVPAGWGDPVFGKLDARLAAAMLSIGGVKAVGFGKGFEFVNMRGSQANDQFADSFKFETNNAGGISGGFSTGDEILLQIAVKATPTIGIEQTGIDVHGVTVKLPGWGRHDPVLCPRLVPVAEAMAALALADAMLANDAMLGSKATMEELRYAIDAVDERIIRAVNERMGLARQIGKQKKLLNLDVVNDQRERELLLKWREFAGSLALDVGFIEKILDLLIEQSRKEQ